MVTYNVYDNNTICSKVQLFIEIQLNSSNFIINHNLSHSITTI